MSPLPRVLMLAGAGWATQVVARTLGAHFQLIRIVVESPPSRAQLVRRRIKRLGAPRVLDQLVFQAMLSPLLTREARARVAEIKMRPELAAPPLPASITKHVESVNDKDVIQALAEDAPDVVVVQGTRILSKQVLQATKAPFINTHAGITPTYRGVHGGYWALRDQRPDLCGVTVHLVDAGIDTGGVIAQARIHPSHADNFATYPLLQLEAALPLLADAVRAAASNTLSLAAPLNAQSHLRYHPEASAYLGGRWLFGVK